MKLARTLNVNNSDQPMLSTPPVSALKFKAPGAGVLYLGELEANIDMEVEESLRGIMVSPGAAQPHFCTMI